jgi:hypothetical protein
LWPRRAILRHHPGLAASPPVGYPLKTERGNTPSPFPCGRRCRRITCSRTRVGGAYRGTAGPALQVAQGRTTRRERALMPR